MQRWRWPGRRDVAFEVVHVARGGEGEGLNVEDPAVMPRLEGSDDAAADAAGAAGNEDDFLTRCMCRRSSC